MFNELSSENRSLIRSCQSGNLSQTKKSVEDGANVNICVNLGFCAPPIVHAVKSGHNDIVKYLLENGANPNVFKNKSGEGYWIITDSKSRTLLEIARETNNNKLVQMLDDYGAV